VLCGCFTFPGRWPSGRSKQRPPSQWRDRAGFAPDFPVRPLVGAQARLALYHDLVNADKSAPIGCQERRSPSELLAVARASRRGQPTMLRRCPQTVGNARKDGYNDG
jgi:hypothetical protein